MRTGVQVDRKHEVQEVSRIMMEIGVWVNRKQEVLVN